MNNDYQSLPRKLMTPNTVLWKSRDPASSQITLEDSAKTVLTDFSHTRPFSISSTATIEQINEKMMGCGVRLLFVAEADGVLHGLVTYNDIFGEKPVRYIQEHGGSREDILVQDIMTPLAQLEALQYEDIIKASVGDILETIKDAGRQHMVVIRSMEDGSQVIAGLYSSTHIEKILGMKIELSPRANTFAELKRVLSA